MKSACVLKNKNMRWCDRKFQESDRIYYCHKSWVERIWSQMQKDLSNDRHMAKYNRLINGMEKDLGK